MSNNNDIDIFITHFDPDKTTLRYRKILKQSIKSIRKQKFAGKINIIIADDGSQWSEELAPSKGYKIYSKEEISKNKNLKDLDIDLYIVKKREESFGKAPLLNFAVKQTTSNNLIFLDDDHPFLTKKSVSKYFSHLSNYDFVLGSLINQNWRVRRFHYSLVQGTNFGLSRSLFNRIGGFGEHTSQWGCGVDPDLFWRVYKDLSQSSIKKAIFDPFIITRDIAKGRWHFKSDREFAKIDFKKKYGTDMHKNDSRNKNLWMDYAGSQRIGELFWSLYNVGQSIFRLILKILFIEKLVLQ